MGKSSLTWALAILALLGLSADAGAEQLGTAAQARAMI